MQVEKLSNVVSFLPKSKLKAGEATETGKYVFFTSSDIKRSYINKFLYDDELIVLGTGGTASCNYYNGKFAVSTDNFVMKPNKTLLVKYLYYFLRKDNLCILQNGFRGTGLKHISKEYISNIEVPIFSLSKQMEIVAFLDEINLSIDICKKRISFYDELIKSRFNEMFGDPVQNEKGFEQEKLSIITPFNKVKNQISKNDNTWLLNLDAIEPNTGVVIRKDRTSKLNGSIIEFDKSCVLYSKLRPYLNKVVVPDEDGFATSEMIALKCNNNIRRVFLAFVLRHKSFVDFINSTSGGTKMPRANMDALKDFLLIVPPITLQNEFSSFVQQIDKLKFNIENIQ